MKRTSIVFTTWDEIEMFILAKQPTSQSWRSDRTFLLEAIGYAKQNDLPALYIREEQLSSLREIVPTLRKAVARDDHRLFIHCFDQAADLTIVELRHFLRHLEPLILNPEWMKRARWS